jgi:hypothetical protein
MANTRPEVRTDKNGRSVTRHVKVDDGAGVAAKRQIPAVPVKSATKPQFGGEMSQGTSVEGKAYDIERHPFKPTQPNAYPTFTLTCNGRSATFQQYDNGQIYDGGKEWAGANLDQVADYYF